MEQGSRTRLGAALVLASVFASGILLGYAVDRGPAQVTIAEASTGDEPGAEPRRRVPVWESMNPSEAQRSVIDSIMRVHRDHMNKLHADFDIAQQAYQSNYDSVILETREAIAAVFPPEQAAVYRQLLAEYDRRREERRASRPRD